MRRTALLIVVAAVAAACADPTGVGGSGGDDASASDAGSSSGSAAMGSNSGTTGATTAASSGGSGESAASSSGSSGSTSGTTGTTSGTIAGTTSAGSTTTTTGAGFGGGTTSSSCYPNDSYVGLGNASACCSDAVDASGYCVDPNATTTTSGGTTTSSTTTSGTTTSGTTGTTTGGTTGGTCPVSCYSARGYHCDNGQCVLNGATGDLQVTLQWDKSLQAGSQRAREDMDLHVVEPNGCEIYYGNTNRPGETSSCPAVGWLDLDQNPGCSDTDNQGGFGDDTENVIYPADGGAPRGTYTVYVVDYEDECDGANSPTQYGETVSDPGTDPSPFAWTVTIRVNGQNTVYSGRYTQSSATHFGACAGKNSGTGITKFTFTN